MMTRGKRFLMMVSVAALAVAAVSALTIDGPASAQAGSRLCGRVWTAPDTGESVIRLIEVSKEFDDTAGNCTHARSGSGGPGDGAPYPLHNTNITSTAIDMVTCESFTTGYLGNRPLELEGNNWPAVVSQDDICLNMNRSDTKFEVETYWLYGESQGAWKFRRG